MKLLALCAILFTVAYGQDCPAFGDWGTQTGCLWHPMSEMRQNMADACGLNFNTSQLPTPKPFPQAVRDQMPDRCGMCSFKFTCRKRDMSPNCFPLDTKYERCSEHPEVCDMPKAPKLNNCKWGFYIEMMKQCTNRPEDELPEWKREGIRQFREILPSINCIEKDDKCKCCCHPFKPNAAGTECTEVQEPEGCQEYGGWNEWSQCLWGLPGQIVSDFKTHCSMGSADGQQVTSNVDFPLPEGFEMPDKCGYCSFKLRCKKRDRMNADNQPRCFPVVAEKQPCGSEDCPTCGNVCSLPKIRDSCDYGSHIRKFLKSRLKKIEKMPYWRKRGYMGIAKNLPHGKCIEKDGQCKCCCHPYEPNAEGTECVVKPFCKLPSELGFNIFEAAGLF